MIFFSPPGKCGMKIGIILVQIMSLKYTQILRIHVGFRYLFRFRTKRTKGWHSFMRRETPSLYSTPTKFADPRHNLFELSKKIIQGEMGIESEPVLGSFWIEKFAEILTLHRDLWFSYCSSIKCRSFHIFLVFLIVLCFRISPHGTWCTASKIIPRFGSSHVNNSYNPSREWQPDIRTKTRSTKYTTTHGTATILFTMFTIRSVDLINYKF